MRTVILTLVVSFLTQVTPELVCQTAIILVEPRKGLWWIWCSSFEPMCRRLTIDGLQRDDSEKKISKKKIKGASTILLEHGVRAVQAS